MKQSHNLLIRISPHILQTLDIIRGKLSRAAKIRDLITDRQKGHSDMDTLQTDIDPTLFYGPDSDRYRLDEHGRLTPEYFAHRNKIMREGYEFAQKYPDKANLGIDPANQDIFDDIENREDFSGWGWQANLEFYHRAKQRKTDGAGH